jgi:hypothetical protein
MPPPPVRSTPRPSLPVYPAEGTETAWLAVVAMFRSAKALQRATLKYWAGDGSDLDPPPDNAPWVRITPSPLPSAYSNRSGGSPDRPVYQMGFSVAIETSIPGTSATDSMRFWGVIFEVLHPSAEADLETQIDQLGAAGIEAIEIKRAAWGLGFEPAGKAGAADATRTYGSGSFDVLMHFET